MALFGKCGLVNFQALQTGNYMGARFQIAATEGQFNQQIERITSYKRFSQVNCDEIKLHDAHSLDAIVKLKAIFYLVRISNHQQELLYKVF